jgi:hypothetical protein
MQGVRCGLTPLLGLLHVERLPERPGALLMALPHQVAESGGRRSAPPRCAITRATPQAAIALPQAPYPSCTIREHRENSQNKRVHKHSEHCVAAVKPLTMHVI